MLIYTLRGLICKVSKLSVIKVLSQTLSCLSSLFSQFAQLFKLKSSILGKAYQQTKTEFRISLLSLYGIRGGKENHPTTLDCGVVRIIKWTRCNFGEALISTQLVVINGNNCICYALQVPSFSNGPASGVDPLVALSFALGSKRVGISQKCFQLTKESRGLINRSLRLIKLTRRNISQMQNNL